MRPRPAPRLDSSRERFRRRRVRAMAKSGGLAAVLVAIAGLLLAPNEVASVRLGGVSLAWWATLAGQATALLALAVPDRGPDRR